LAIFYLPADQIKKPSFKTSAGIFLRQINWSWFATSIVRQVPHATTIFWLQQGVRKVNFLERENSGRGSCSWACLSRAKQSRKS
jgi:hypothetical protein